MKFISLLIALAVASPVIEKKDTDVRDSTPALEQPATVLDPTAELEQALPIVLEPVFGYTPRHVANIKVSNPAMLYLQSFESAPNKKDLFISSFTGNPFGADNLYHIADIGSKLKTEAVVDALVPTRLNPSVNWPNGVTYVPKSMFGSEGVVVAGGFLVKGKGNIYFSSKNATDGSMGDLVTLFSSSEYFYHRAIVYDVDQDGQLDLLTCRAKKSGPSFALTWLTPVNRANPQGLWVEKVISAQKGCDTYFTMADLNNDGVMELVAALFWGQSFGIVSTDSSRRFDDISKLTFTTINALVGKSFDLQYVDVNADGKMVCATILIIQDFLLTNHQGPNEALTGSLFAFTFDSADFKNPSSWTRRTLSNNLKPITGIFSIGAGAPGSPQAFYPTIKGTGKPAIALAGDDSQKAWLVVPNSQDHNDWNYTTQALHDCKGTVGTLAVGDADGDGFTDLFVPCYSSGNIAVYTFA